MSILTTSGSRIWLYVFAVICFTHSVTNNASGDYCVSTATELQNALTTAANSENYDLIKIKKGTYHGNFVYNSANSGSLRIWGDIMIVKTKRRILPIPFLTADQPAPVLS